MDNLNDKLKAVILFHISNALDPVTLAEVELLLPNYQSLIASDIRHANYIDEQKANILILTVGLPRSGKSTWAKTLNYPIVSPDAIRLALHGQRYIQEVEPHVWVMARWMVESLFLAGHQFVILDACNVTQARRNEWQSTKWACRFHVIDTDEQVCMRRAVDAGDVDIYPIIASMAIKFEPLGADEEVFF